MKKNIYQNIVLTAIPIALFVGTDYIIKIGFIPSLNNLIKRNYFLIFFILCTIYLIGLLVVKFRITRLNKTILAVLTLPVFINAYLSGLFYGEFEQKVVQKFQNNSYLISTYNPGFFICTRQASLIKQEGIFVKRLYNIGCPGFTIIGITNDQIKLVVEIKPLFMSQKSTYDTVTVKL